MLMVELVTPWSVAPVAFPGPHGDASVPNLAELAAEATPLPPTTAVAAAVETTMAKANSALVRWDFLVDPIAAPQTSPAPSGQSAHYPDLCDLIFFEW